jgi:hypothetical protein
MTNARARARMSEPQEGQMKTARQVRSAALFVALTFATSGAAHAQAFLDHLKCHKVKDPLKLPRTTADLMTDLQPDFAASGCRILKAKYFCAPVAKQNVVPAPPRPDIVGQGLTQDFICYKTQCPVQPPDHEVTDQFGNRTQTKYKTDLLCVPAVKGNPTTTTTTTVASTTTTTQPNTCCGAQRMTLTSTGGRIRNGTLVGSTLPAGIALTVDAGPAGAFPACDHPVTVPAGGFTVPSFCLPDVGFTASLEALGCAAGGTDGSGTVWDGAATCPAANASKVGDTSDGACNPAGQPCNTLGGGAGANTLGDIDTTRGGAPCGAPGLHALVDVPLRLTWWLPQNASCPDPDGQFDPGTDTLVVQLDHIMTLVTGAANADFEDENGDTCSFAGNGPDHTKHCSGDPSRSCSANSHCSIPAAGTCVDGPTVGVPAPGPCCQAGQSMTLVSAGLAFQGSAPLNDSLAHFTIPMQVTSCSPWPGPATCTLPNSCQD